LNISVAGLNLCAEDGTYKFIKKLVKNAPGATNKLEANQYN